MESTMTAKRISEMSETEISHLLESLIDSRGLKTVINTVSNICVEKSQHIEVSYSDKWLAKTWMDDAYTIGKTSDKLKN